MFMWRHRSVAVTYNFSYTETVESLFDIGYVSVYAYTYTSINTLMLCLEMIDPQQCSMKANIRKEFTQYFVSKSSYGKVKTYVRNQLHLPNM